MTLEDVEAFWEWVRQEADARGWSIREVERRAGFTYGRLNNAANLLREPTIETCQGISQAFGISLIEVQRKAGLLPSGPTSEQEAEIRELAEMLASLPDGPIREQAMVGILAIARDALARARERERVAERG